MDKKKIGIGMMVGIGIVVLIVIIGMVAGPTGNRETGPSNGETESSNGMAEPGSGNLKIIEDELVRIDEGTSSEEVFVKGLAQNVSEKKVHFAKINVDFYTEYGHHLTKQSAYTTDLADGEVWSFEVSGFYYGEDAARIDYYKINAEIITRLCWRNKC